MNGSRRGNELWIGLVAASAWALPCLITAFFGVEGRLDRFAGSVASLLIAVCFLLLAAGLGGWLLDRIPGLPAAFAGRAFFAAGLGLGAFSIGTFLVGLVRVPSAGTAWAVLIALSVLLARRTGGLLLALHAGCRDLAARRVSMGTALAAIIGVVFCLNLLRAFVPPMEYDEMEYHLAAPARYFRDGQITRIADNAYAHFPQNVEMLFLDAMVLRGGVEEGFALGASP